MVTCKVLALDGGEYTFEVLKSQKVQHLFDSICKELGLTEKHYFGLTLEDKKTGKVWLDNCKKLGKYAVKANPVFSLEVKLYPPKPDMLADESTRFQLFLQLRRDVISGKLPCSFLTLALLGSYAARYHLCAQGPSADELVDFQHLSDVVFAEKQTEELLERMTELLETHRNLSPEEAEYEFLINAKKLSLYGVHKHNAKDLHKEDVQIGVCAAGLLVFKEQLRVHQFVWARIIKFSYRHNIFTIHIRPGEDKKAKSTFAFKLDSPLLAKRLWRLAAEHHVFFRLKMSETECQNTMAKPPRFMSIQRNTNRLADRRFSAPAHTMSKNKQFIDRPGSTTTFMMTERQEEIIQGGSRPPSATLRLRTKPRHSLPLIDLMDSDGSSSRSSCDGRKKAELWRINKTLENKPSASHHVNGYATTVYTGNHNHNFQHTNGPRSNDMRCHQHQGLAVRATNEGYNYNDDDEDLPPYQDDHLKQEQGGSDSISGRWSVNPSSSQVKASTRMYGGPGDSTMAKHQTEREGQIEMRLIGTQQEELFPDCQHDKAFSDAVLAAIAAIDLNADMSVETIVIQTRK